MNRLNRPIRKALFAAVAASAAIAAAAPAVAHADASCASLLPAKFAYLKQNGGAFTFEITVTKDPLTYVTYSRGHFTQAGSYFFGTADLQFSDRYKVGQNFDNNATEPIQVWLSSTGALWIFNQKYTYWITSNFDMSCTGGLVSKYVPNLGLVTVALREWFFPIP